LAAETDFRSTVGTRRPARPFAGYTRRLGADSELNLMQDGVVCAPVFRNGQQSEGCREV